MDGKYIPDFILVSEKGSLGLQYTLVEIERPSVKTVTDHHNNPSAGLTHATKQIRDWKYWVERNSQSVSSLFPSKFSLDSNDHIKYMLIAGRRKDINSEQQLERVKIANDLGYEIRSFDYITDNLNSFRADDHIFPNSDINQEYWNAGLYHEFANPFYKSIPNNEWKKISSSPDLIRAHMISSNLKLINSFMKTNERYQDYLDMIKT